MLQMHEFFLLVWQFKDIFFNFPHFVGALPGIEGRNSHNKHSLYHWAIFNLPADFLSRMEVTIANYLCMVIHM